MNYNQILNTLLFYKGKLLRLTVLSVILIFLILLIVFPRTYRSEVTILPPENNSNLGGLGTLLGADGFSGILTGGMSTANSQLFMEIIKSRNASLYVVDKFDLQNFYDSDNKYLAAKELNENMSIEVTKEGIIKLDVEVKTGLFPIFRGSEVDSIRKLSASISNTYVEALDKINREKLSSKAKRAREYIELQLADTKRIMDSVETALTLFQQKNKTISLPEQLTASLETASKLKAEIVKTEIELGLLQNNIREDNKLYISLKNKLDELRGQYSKMEIGDNDFLIAFNNVPELGRELAVLMREVKIQNEVYLLLQQQFYKEKIQENRDLPTVEVLDEAVPPIKSASPRIFFSSVLGGLFVLVIASVILIVNEKKTLKFKNQSNKQ